MTAWLYSSAAILPQTWQVLLLDVVVGNPPYVSYHNMSEQTRSAAKQVAINDAFDLTPKASLWAFFLLHATGFSELIFE